MLNTSLLSLALGTHLVIVSLTRAVTSQASNGTSNSALNTVADTRAEVVDLTLGLLVAAIEILFTAGLLQRLYIVISRGKEKSE